MKSVYIFCKSFTLNQDKIKSEFTELPKKSESIYIAADSGLETIKKFDIVPDIIIGDFDSVNPAILSFYKNRDDIEIIKHPAQKNDTDSMLAVKYALGRGYKNIVIIGGIDGRIDHTLANLFCLKYIRNRNGNGCITNGYNKISYISNSRTRIYKNKDYKYVSIIPISPEIRGVTLSGFFYTLKNADVSLEEPYTVCNEIAEDCEYGEIEILEGDALICECGDFS
ncbi:MAG: thiamine diphosphokinase [Oscillospiraceae bacterium]|nr:thiamine diphosphokinase [Oscillospiraceae bacterium]